MKKLVVFMFCFMLLFALIGCGQQAEEGSDDTAAHGQAEEVADSTRMDSAAVDTMAEEVMDSAAAAVDSM